MAHYDDTVLNPRGTSLIDRLTWDIFIWNTLARSAPSWRSRRRARKKAKWLRAILAAVPEQD